MQPGTNRFAALPAQTIRAGVCVAMSAILVAALASWSSTTSAYAEDIDTDFEISALQQQIEESQAAYEAAVARSEELAKQIEANQATIAELSAQLPEAREKAHTAAVELYKSQSSTGSLLDFIFSAQDFNDLLTKVDYMNRVTQNNMAAISELESMEAALTQAQADLQAQKDDADSQAAAADEALQTAQAARLDAQRRAQEQAQAAAEAAAAASAAASGSAEDVAAAMDSATADSENAAVTDSADWSSDEATFIAEWGSRIDAYLSGTPLAGYGSVFAEAAWDYGVDPRWSPAISYVESSCGRYCFKSHNAWGWGSVSWDSWEEAIRGHVSGLARGYGYTLTMANARKYCPPNAQHWYDTCLAQMNNI